MIAGLRINDQIKNYTDEGPEVTSGVLIEILLKVTPDFSTVTDCG